MSFRPHLTILCQQWEDIVGDATRPADGFFLVNELRLPCKQATSPPGFAASLQEAIKAITTAIAYPIRYAGPGEWTGFSTPTHTKRCPHKPPLPS